MGGFISGVGGKQVETGFSETNNAGTYYGAADQGFQTIQNVMGKGFGLNPAQNAASTSGLPGSKVLGHAGGALSAIGLLDNVYDMTQNGVDANNGMNAASNALNVGSWGAATFGAAGGAASTVAAPLMAAGAAGLSLGMASNSYMSEKGWLGNNENGTGRSWSDMAGDWGTSWDEAAGGGALGTAAGIAGVLAGSVVGTAGTIATAPMVIGHGLWNGASAIGGGIGHAASAIGGGIADGVGALLSW